jgi:hypothetical protein
VGGKHSENLVRENEMDADLCSPWDTRQIVTSLFSTAHKGRWIRVLVTRASSSPPFAPKLTCCTEQGRFVWYFYLARL